MEIFCFLLIDQKPCDKRQKTLLKINLVVNSVIVKIFCVYYFFQTYYSEVILFTISHGGNK